MPRDKNARVGAAVPSVGGYCCWIRFFFFFFFFSPPTVRFSPFFILLYISRMGLGTRWNGVRKWRFGGEAFYLRWRVDELKFEKVGRRGIYFKWD